MNCPECGIELSIGLWPYCPHGSILNRDAANFPPIVLHQDAATGEYSFPASASEPVPDGYRKIEIRNMREADRYVREIGSSERSKLVEMRENNRLYFEERRKETRERVDAEMRRRGLTSGRALLLRDRVRQYVDRKHAERYSSARSLDLNFHNQALSFDSSNRQGHSGPETNWRNRKD